MRSVLISITLISTLALVSCAHGYGRSGPAFNTVDVGELRENVPVVQPWRVVKLDPEYGGCWNVAGDLDGDGVVEIVSAQNHNDKDTHYTSAAVAQKLDGTVLWRWGDPKLGRKELHHDVALQIHDWDGDGRNEVVLLADRALVELDGATGHERRRLPIPEAASDSLVFCDLSGVGRPTDFLVKTRYTSIWAYNRAGELLWQSEMPGGYRTAHQARPIDLDGDGRDEIMAGYALLDSQGRVMWTIASEKTDLRKGHLDCARVLKHAKNPKDTRIALTCCGAQDIMLIDGTGRTMREIPGHHFESITIGNILPGRNPEILVDIDHTPRGESDMWILDGDGTLRGTIRGDYCRHHGLIDWTGDGLDEIVVGNSGAMYDRAGKRIATLAAPAAGTLLIGDFTGDCVPDVARASAEAVYIYRNDKGRKPASPVPLGTPLNYTYY